MEANLLQPILDKLDDVKSVLNEVKTDVAVIKSHNYDERLVEVDKLIRSHGERLTRAEVRGGFIAALVSAIGGAITYLFSGGHPG